MNKKSTKIILSSVLTAIFAVCLFYIQLPALNLQSEDFWSYLFICALFFVASYALLNIFPKRKEKNGIKNSFFAMKKSKIILIVVLVLIPMIILMLGTLFSSTVFNAKAYSELITVTEANFAEDMPEADVVKNIALMDTATAIAMGDRTLGAVSLSDVISQYEVSENYKQINYNNPIIKGLCSAVDLYLDLFRKIIPPVGMFDFSPIVASFVLVFIRNGILYATVFIMHAMGMIR